MTYLIILSIGAGPPKSLYWAFPDLIANLPKVVVGKTDLNVSIVKGSKEGGKALPCSSIK